MELAAKLTDPTLIIAVLVAIAVFASFYTLAMPYLERGDLGEAGVHVDQDQRVPGQLVAQRAADGVGQVELLARDEALSGPERVELEGLEALRQHRFGRFQEGFRRPLGAIPAIGVARHAVANLAAEKLVDRHAERLAQNVPAGDLDRRDHGAMDMAAVERYAVQQALGQRVDAARVLADGEMPELVHAGFRRLDEAVERALADAMDTLVGMDLDEQPVFPAGPDGEGLDLGDLHAAVSDPAIVWIIACVVRPYFACSVGTAPHSM